MSLTMRAYVGMILPIFGKIINTIFDQVCIRVGEGDLTPIMFVASEIDNLYHCSILLRQAHEPVAPTPGDGLTLRGTGKKIYKPNDHFCMVTMTISAGLGFSIPSIFRSYLEFFPPGQ